jgi:hypothetical protein
LTPAWQGHAGDQAVERIVLGRAVEDRRQRALDRFTAREHGAGFKPGRKRQGEIVDRAKPPFIKRGRLVFDHPEAEILERRDHI